MDMKRFNVNSKVPILAKWTFCCFFTLFTASISEVKADNTLTNNDVFAKWEHVSDSELDASRGGFLLPNGVNLDLSIEKVVLINGEAISTQKYQLPETMNTLVQNGIRNHYAAPELPGSTLGSVIQNTMDYQTIQNIKTIDIEISNVKNLANFNNDIALQNFLQHY